ncbi:MAG: hypothetical protein JNG83_09585, partial [Opitutaceae bacterium]|nr:hypothetical protein [Opitutaceae bacterium]
MPHPASRRPRPFRTNLAAACLALSGLLAPAPGPASTPPAALTIEELAREPQIGSFKLAPGGRYFGAIVTDEQERHSLLIYDLDRNTASAVKAHGELDISSFRWVSDEQLLYNVIRENRYAFGLFSIQRDGLRKQTQFNAYDATTLVGIPRARPNRALVWIRQSSRDGGRDQGLVEIRTDRASRSAGSAETSQVYAPPRDGTVLNWRAGPNGELAYCYVYRDRTTRLHRYDQDNRTWH